MKQFHFFLIISSLFVLSNATSSMAQLRFDYPITTFEPAILKVDYSLEWLQDTLSPDLLRQTDVTLIIGNNSSKYLGHTLYLFDSIMRTISNIEEFQAFALNPIIHFPSFSTVVYKNIPTGKMTITDHVIGNSYIYVENMDLFTWHLTGRTDTVFNYTIQEATANFGGRSWIAWFAPEIPYSDGPYKFNGLPGLILKVYDTRKHYVFDILSIEKPEYELMIDRQEKDFVETTRQGFFRAQDDFRENIISRTRDAGLDNEEQHAAARKMAERNNPIELIRK